MSTEERIAKILNQDNNIPASEVLKYLDYIWRYKEIEVYNQMTEEEEGETEDDNKEDKE